MTLPLFDVDPVPPPPPEPKLSPDRRRTQRQRQAVEAGAHPLALVFGAAVRRHTDPQRTCGDCLFRRHQSSGGRRWPKCMAGDGARASRGAATDVRRHWPACAEHEWGDTGVGPDAARWVP